MGVPHTRSTSFIVHAHTRACARTHTHVAKLAVVSDAITTLPLGSKLIISDVDVSVFRSLAPLLGFHDREGNGVTFLAENYKGAAREPKVNCGFQLMTVTEETRRLVAWWRRQAGDEQITINWWEEGECWL